MTTSISGLSGNQGGEQRNAAAGTQGAAQTQDSAQDSKQDAKRSGDFRQPDTIKPQCRVAPAQPEPRAHARPRRRR